MKTRLLLCVWCILAGIAAGHAQDFAGGTGTATDPYLIKTPQQLNNLSNYLGSANSDKYFKLGNDIDVSSFIEVTWGAAGWKPIGDFEMPFTGQLDGANHKVTGLWMHQRDYVGLFGCINKGTIANLGVVIDNGKGGIKGRSYVGGLVGYSNGGNITNCYATGDVTSSAYPSFPDSLSSSFSSSAGGLVGENWSGSITNCYATGNVTSSSTSFISSSSVGGLVGLNGGGSIANCYATGNVSSSSDSSSDSNSYPSSFASAGGLIGIASAGIGDNRISNCYATGRVKAAGSDVDLGCLIGYNDRSSIFNSYFLKQGSLNGIGNEADNANVTGLTVTQMKQRSSFPSFDFNTIWDIDEGKTYPNLRGVGNNRPTANESLPNIAASLLVKVIDGVLHVSNLFPGEQLNVYNLQGQLVYTARATGSEQQIPLSGKGAYIVTAGGRTQKVVLR